MFHLRLCQVNLVYSGDQSSNILGNRTELDKKSDNDKGFEYHIKFEHNLWNYLFYVAYVQNKDHTEYTGMESYVANQIENEEIDWFPIERNADFEGERNAESENMIFSRIYQEKLVGLKETVNHTIAILFEI